MMNLRWQFSKKIFFKPSQIHPKKKDFLKD